MVIIESKKLAWLSDGKAEISVMSDKNKNLNIKLDFITCLSLLPLPTKIIINFKAYNE